MDRLRPFWDFDDLDGTERRFREELEREHDPSRRAEVLTQLARVAGLRGDFPAGERLLDDAERVGAPTAAVEVRVLLERGRLLRSSGDSAAALPLFVSAFERGVAAGEGFLAGDAAHMAALAAPDPTVFREWTQRGLDYASSEPAAAYWRGTLLNNLGWLLHDRGDLVEALAVFEQALRVREEDPERPQAIEHAREAVALTQQALRESSAGPIV